MTQQEQIEKAIKEKQMRIDKAINNKELQIAYFNSLNSAISFCPNELKGTEEGFDKIMGYRDRFLEEWKEFNASKGDIEVLPL